MEVSQIIKKLIENKEFKEWKSSNKGYYLVHAFKMLDECNKDDWQFGYYDCEKDKMVTFIVEKEDIRMVPEKEIFRKEKEKIKEIDLKKAKLKLEKILDIATAFMKDKYSEKAVKTIILLQNLDIGQVWNITFLTSSFKTLNLKITCDDGKILKHEFASLLQFEA